MPRVPEIGDFLDNSPVGARGCGLSGGVLRETSQGVFRRLRSPGGDS